MSPAGQVLLDDILAIKAGALHRKRTPEQMLVLAIRIEQKLSQREFSKLLGVPVGTIRDWEQGHKQPGSVAITLLKVAEKHPDILEEVAAWNIASRCFLRARAGLQRFR